MTKPCFSLVIFQEDKDGRAARPFLATRDPDIVRVVRDLISTRLRNKQVAHDLQNKMTAGGR